MRVLFDHQVFCWQLYGGVSRYYVELVRHLARMDETEPLILAPLFINQHLRELEATAVAGRYVGLTPTGISWFTYLANRMLAPRRMGRLDPDIVHETYYAKKPVVGRHHCKTVLTVYDMILERFPDGIPHSSQATATKARAVERADHIICISEQTRQDLLDICNVDPASVTVVHLGIDAVSAVGLPGAQAVDGPYLLYVGQRGGHKNFSRLVEAYIHSSALHDEFSLVCFGGPPLAKDETDRLGLAGIDPGKLVWMKGDDRMLTWLYRDAAALIYPSLYEGFGIPPLEAMGQGCPVVCSTGGSIPEVVGDAGEFFDPYDAGEIAAAIERVVGGSNRASELQVAGYERLRHFSWERCAQQTRDAYASLL